MAQLTLDLTQFKSAGVYTLEIDETVSYTVETNALRLLVGFSAKGPFNKPVFLRNDDDARTVFGSINEKLEHKGSYFNRFAETLSRRTPIFAISLLNVDEKMDGPDQVNYAAFSLDAGKPNPEVLTTNKKLYGEDDYCTTANDLIYASKSGKIPYVGNVAYASLFDRTRFWDASEENLLSAASLGLHTNDTISFEHTNFFNIANVGTEEISILVFKPENLSGYDITCEEWYQGRQNIPYGFIRPNDFVGDYFIQVVAVKGNWSNYNFLSTDENWSEYFDHKGIKKHKINSFLSSNGISIVGSWIGSIIPGFKNTTGEFVDIVAKINNNTTITGILASFNKDAATALAFDYDGDDERDRGWFIDDDGNGEMDPTESPVSESTYLIDMVGHNFQNGYSVITESEDEEGETTETTETRYGINFLSYTYDSDSIEEITEKVSSTQYFYNCATDADGNGPITSDFKNMFIITKKSEADKLTIGDLVNNDTEDENIIPGLTKVVKKIWVALNSESTYTTDEYGCTTIAEDDECTFSYKGKDYTYSGEAIYDKNFGKLGFYLLSTIESVALTDGEIVKQKKISDSAISRVLKFIPLKGLSITKRHLPGYDKNGNLNVEAGVEKIYSMLSEEGIMRGLKNKQMINFRYVIDSMSNGIAPMLGGKVYLSQLAKTKGKSLAILNAPSKKNFARSTNPYFCDTFVNGIDVRPAFKTEWIPKGGNDEIYCENRFSLPDEDNGATFSAAFFPNLVYSIQGREVSVPPAADVANALVRKFSSANSYSITANEDGYLSNPYLKGVEYPLDDYDRDALEPFGINPIITRNGNVLIYGNQTCYQRVKSDLNKLHIRENLNTIEIAVDAALQKYVFLYNNAQTRADLVQKVTPILQAAKTSGAIDSFTIQCDEKNNTEEIISASFGIVDITLVMAHGMEKIVSTFKLKRNNTTQN